MKKSPLLNRHLSALVAAQGHGDTICVADAGLPIPLSANCIDLSVTPGMPAVADVLEALASELCIESITLADELATVSSAAHDQIIAWIEAVGAAQNKPVSVNYVSHEFFKKMTHEARAVVRTGECTPYVNVIISSGVPF